MQHANPELVRLIESKTSGFPTFPGSIEMDHCREMVLFADKKSIDNKKFGKPKNKYQSPKLEKSSDLYIYKSLNKTPNTIQLKNSKA